MVAICDPRKARYPPESVPEGQAIAQASVTASTLAEYFCDPNLITIERVEVQQTASMDLRIALDGVSNAAIIRGNALAPITGLWNDDTPEDHFRIDKYPANNTAAVSLQMTAGTAANPWARWNVVVRQPTVVELIRRGLSRTGEQEDIANLLNLYDKLSLGLIPNYPDLHSNDVYKMFDRIEIYNQTLAALAASSDNTIWGRLDVSLGEVWVCLGFGCESSHYAAGTVSDTFFEMDRDSDPSYVKMDMVAMPNYQTVRCFIPFTQKALFHIRTTTGTGANTMPSWFIIGKRKATVIDHIKWGDKFPPRSNVEQLEINTLLNKYPDEELVKKIKAGVL